MFDTIRLELNKNQHQSVLAKENLVSQDFVVSCHSGATSGRYRIFKPPKNRQFYNGKLSIDYLPKAGIIGSKEGLTSLFVEFSCPKLLYGSNLFDVSEQDLPLIAPKLVQILARMGVNLTKDEILYQALVTRLDIAQNFYLSSQKFFHIDNWFSCLAWVSFDKRKDHHEMLVYQNGDEDGSPGFAFKETLSPNSGRKSSVTTYLKSQELIHKPTTVAEYEVAQYLKNHDLLSNILRQEKSRCGQQEVERPFKGVLPALHLNNIFQQYSTIQRDFQSYSHVWNCPQMWALLQISASAYVKPFQYLQQQLIKLGLSGNELMFATSLCTNIAELGYDKGVKQTIAIYGEGGRKLWKSVEKHISQLSPQKLSSFTFSQIGKEINYQTQHPQHISSLDEFDAFVAATDQRLLQKRANKRTLEKQ